MNDKIKDGGFAFARAACETAEAQWSDAQTGMALRDYFAAKAMQGMLAGWRDGDPCIASEISNMAYIVADAMLVKRETP